MSNTTPPGWYPDQQVPGQVRYWDGNAWTSQTAPSGAAGPSAPGGPTGPGGAAPIGQGEKKNWFLRHKILTGVLAVLLLIIIATAAGSGGGGDDSGDDVADDPAASTQPTPKQRSSTAGTSPSPSPKETTAAPPKSETPTPEPEPDLIAVKAVDILKEFEDNELAADSKYKDQTLKISGRVNKIDTDLFDDDKYILMIGGGGEFEFLTVNCNGVSNEELATLKVGQKVTAIGEFDDGGDLGVEVNDCKLA